MPRTHMRRKYEAVYGYQMRFAEQHEDVSYSERAISDNDNDRAETCLHSE
jgi:hypothetical protein